MTITIGFIGAGNMASALVGGLLARGHQPQHLALADANTSQLAGFTEQHIFTTTNNADIFQRADVIVLAVKPQVLCEVLKPLAAIAQTKKPLIIRLPQAFRLTVLTAG